MTASRDAHAPAEHTAAHSAGRWQHRLSVALLVVVVGGIYLATLYPDVRHGDSAELQVMSALLGVAHPPGYALEMTIGRLFSALPIGPNIAWRVNLMQAICGVVGALALYGTLRRLTGQLLPGLVAALTLAFSTVYWMHSVIAEVYVFHGMFLLLGVYTAVRFVTSDKGGWLHATALLLGICVTGRPSEVFVLPAFVVLWLGFRRRVRLSPGRIGVAVILALLPLVYTLGFYVVREDPALLHARDDALRDEILDVGTPLAELPLSQQVHDAVSYSLGFKAAGRADFTSFSWERVAWDINKYAWLLSGAGAFGDRYEESQVREDQGIARRQREQGRGTSVGVLGLSLALVGVTRWRRQRGAVLLGLVMFVGNLVYYVYMHPVDNLHFTIPGLAGLAVLIGLGVATRGHAESRGRSIGYQVACFVVPALLLVTNFNVVNFRKSSFPQERRLAQAVREAALPPRPAIIAMYPRAQRLRYLYWLEVGRTDVHVIVFRERFSGDELRRLVGGLRQMGFTPLISADVLGGAAAGRSFTQGTPRELVEVGLFVAGPVGGGTR